MGFEKKIFIIEYSDLIDIEKTVFDETLFDLEFNAKRRALFEGRTLFELVPTDRILNQKIRELYDIKDLSSNLNFIHHRWKCIDVLENAGVISDVIDYPFKHTSMRLVAVKVDLAAVEQVKNWLKGNNLDKKAEELPVYEIKYQEPKIILMGLDGQEIALKRTNYNSQAERVFRYIYENPNKNVSKADMNQYLSSINVGEVNRSLNEILKDLGFTGGLGKLFIKNKSKHDIYFRNPVFWEDLEQLGMAYIEPSKLI